MGRMLDQNRNYNAEFGFVFRSSTIFAVIPECKCTFSILNYWKLKNQTSISLVVTERSREGAVVDRRILGFDNSEVINIRPGITCGSVEIEAFGNRNLRIPYAAVMGIYETPNSIAMVHSYGRNHSPSEIEDDVAVLDAREGCISLRCDSHIRTRAIFHNGNLAVPAQVARLILTNNDGRERAITFDLAAIAPYQTVWFDIDRLAPDFREFLGKVDGWAALHFDNRSSFPRMLVCWIDARSGAVQTTHSNFDYTQYETNLLSEDVGATLALPALNGRLIDQAVVIYPRCAPGSYRVGIGNHVLCSKGGSVIPLDYVENGRVAIDAIDGQLPSRLVTALYGRPEGGELPFECSLGVFHSGRPPKRYHWAVVSERRASRIYLTAYPEIYGDPDEIELRFSLYGAASAEPAVRSLRFASLGEVPLKFELENLFENAAGVLGGDYGYMILTSNWGGFMAYTSLEKQNSFAIEHSF